MSNENKSYCDFLKKLNKVSEENSKIEGFNIFRTLRLDHDETRMHSRFIAYLLNPDGSHGMNDFFLLEFLKLCNIDPQKFNTKTVKIETEFPLGKIDYEEPLPKGGLLDILVLSEKYVLGIENKIDAVDQKKQLRRYYNSLKEKFPEKERVLIYLSPTGKIPSQISWSDISKCKKIKEYSDRNKEICYLMSYCDDIENWLITSKKNSKASINQRFNQSIEQYIEIIMNIVREYRILEKIVKFAFDENKIKVKEYVFLSYLMNNPNLKGKNEFNFDEKKIIIDNPWSLSYIIENPKQIKRKCVRCIIDIIISETELEQIIPTWDNLLEYSYYFKINNSLVFIFKFAENRLYYGFSKVDESNKEMLKESGFEKPEGKTSFKYRSKKCLTIFNESISESINAQIEEIKNDINIILYKINNG